MQKIPITEKISKNNFPLLNQISSQSSSLNFGAPLMNKLRSAIEHRPSLADSLFTEELYGVPHCLATGREEMYHGTKSSIKDRLQSSAPPINTATTPKAVIIEASPLIRKLSNVSVDNFHEFSVIFYSHILRLASGFDRLDVVFDRYFKNSLKRKTRVSDGTRVLNINDYVPFPLNFQDSFLRNPDNKNDLGLYLAPKLISLHLVTGTSRLQLCVTYNDAILSQPALINHSVFPVCIVKIEFHFNLEMFSRRLASHSEYLGAYFPCFG